jgi:hypothetical protein
LKSAALGGATAGVIGKGASLVGKGLSKIGPGAKDLAEKFAVASLGNKDKVIANLGPEGVQTLGRKLLDDGIVTAGKSREELINEVIQRQKAAGEGLGQLAKDADTSIGDLKIMDPEGYQSARVYAPDLKQELKRDLIDPLSKKAGSVEHAQYVDDYLNRELFNLYGKKDIPLSELRDFRSSIDRQIKKFGGLQPDTGKQAALQDIRSALEKKVEGRIGNLDESAAPGLLDEYKNKKLGYGQLSSAKALGEDTLKRIQKNRLFSLTDYLTGSAVAGGGLYAQKNPITAIGGGVLAAAGNRLARSRGNQVAASVLDKLSQRLASNPQSLGKYGVALQRAAQRGPMELAVTHYVLSGEPEYRESWNQDE